MKTYLVDAYNLLYAWPEIPAGSLETKREFIMRWLQDHRPQGRNAVILVFDSREGSGNRYSTKDMQVVFTAGETADDWISAHVRAGKKGASSIVITNDQGLRRMIRGTGAKWMSCDEFLAREKTEAHTPPKRDNPRDRELDQITKDLMNEWL